MKRTTPSPAQTSLNLRKFPKPLLAAMKSEAALLDVTLQEYVVKILGQRQYVPWVKGEGQRHGQA